MDKSIIQTPEQFKKTLNALNLKLKRLPNASETKVDSSRLFEFIFDSVLKKKVNKEAR